MPENKISETSSNFVHFLRAIASQIVVLGHILQLNILPTNSVLAFLPSYSVLIFFVISGYIVSYSCNLKGKEYGLLNYVIDRFSRIYITLIPAFILTIIIGIVYLYCLNSSAFNINWRYLISSFLMQQENPILMKIQYMLPNTETFKFVGVFGNNLPLWSLSIEWWLYMFFGIFYFKRIEQLNGRHNFLLFLSLPFVIGYMFLPGRAGYGLPFIWLSGVVINYLTSKKIIVAKSHMFVLISLIFALVSIKTTPNIAILFFVVFFFFSINYFNELGNNSFYNSFFKLARWPGNYSYSIYIIHYPLILLISSLNLNVTSKIILSLAISNLLALTLYFFFERNHKLLSGKIKKILS
jgi:peptidoglycan/LPS O-acetylase OafA/YrhL